MSAMQMIPRPTWGWTLTFDGPRVSRGLRLMLAGLGLLVAGVHWSAWRGC